MLKLLVLTITTLLLQSCGVALRDTSLNKFSSSDIAESLAKEFVESFGATSLQDSQVTLNWEIPNSESPIENFKIYRSLTKNVDTTASSIATIAPDQAIYVDTSLTNGTKYYYKILTTFADSTTEVSSELEAIPFDVTTPASMDFVFIDPSASGGGDGSYASPYNDLTTTIVNTLTNVQGTIFILDGTLTLTTNVVFNQEVNLRSVSGHYLYSDVIIHSPTVTGSVLNMSIGFTGGSIKGLEFTNAAVSSRIIYGHRENTSEFTIANNYFHDMQVWPIMSNSASHHEKWRILNNRIVNITGATNSGLWFANHDDMTIEGNYIKNIGYNGINLGSMTNLTVTNNTIIEPTKNGGVQLGGASGNVSITYNDISDGNVDTVESDAGCIRLYDPALLTGAVYITNNTMTNCQHGLAIRESSANDISATTITFNNNSLDQMTTKAIYHTGTGILDATDNYWGSTTGPTHSSNPDGTGEVIEDNIGFFPYLTEY